MPPEDITQAWYRQFRDYSKVLLTVSDSDGKDELPIRRLLPTEFAYFLGIHEDDVASRAAASAHLTSTGAAPHSLGAAASPVQFPAGQLDSTGRRTYNQLDLHTAHNLLRQEGAFQDLPRRPAGGRQARVVVCNAKGGTAKTTCAVHLSQYLAQRGHRTLLVDLDGQGTATAASRILVGRDFQDWNTCYGAIVNAKRKLLKTSSQNLLEGMPEASDDYFQRHCIMQRPNTWPDLDLVPGDTSVHYCELVLSNLATKIEGKVLTLLHHELNRLESIYDAVVIDTGPYPGLLSMNAIFNADILVVPMAMNYFDAHATGEWWGQLSAMMQETAPTKNVVDRLSGRPNAILPSSILAVATRVERGKTNKLMHEVIQGMMSIDVPSEQRHQWCLIDEIMVASQAIASAYSDQQSIYEHIPEKGDRRGLDRALASANAVNARIEAAIAEIWSTPTGEGGLA